MKITTLEILKLLNSIIQHLISQTLKLNPLLYLNFKSLIQIFWFHVLIILQLEKEKNTPYQFLDVQKSRQLKAQKKFLIDPLNKFI